MPTVHVDFDTYKAIVARRRTEAMSEGDVIREALVALNSARESSLQQRPGEPATWWHKGIDLPIGLELEHVFRGGRVAQAKVVLGGIEYAGQRFGSLSAAGVQAAGHQVDGWAFWNFRDDRGNLLPMKTKRRV